MTRLFTELVQHTLSEFSYDADLAGLQYSFSAHTLGIYMALSGYNDKLHVLAKDIFKKARNLVIKQDELQIMKDQVSSTDRHVQRVLIPTFILIAHTRLAQLLPQPTIPDI